MKHSEIQTPLRFVVTVDTEADDAWVHPELVKVTNIRELDRFQDLSDKYGVVPTYLLAYECATHDDALKTLLPLAENRACEIGHHLHVWTTPPFQRPGPTGVDLDWIQAYQFQLPDSLFAEKAESLRQAIEDNFGQSPTSHRAGRWGIDQRSADWLANSGFVVETSTRSGICLREYPPGAELTDSHGQSVTATEYELNKNPYLWPVKSNDANGQSIVEVPATADVRSPLASALLLPYLRRKWPAEFFMFRVYRKISGLNMLSPDPGYPPGELPRIIERAIDRGVSVINLMFHSSELALHCSPFTRTQENVDRVWRHLEEAFGYCQDRGILSAGISDIAALARASAQ